jgi:hypothetical protein
MKYFLVLFLVLGFTHKSWSFDFFDVLNGREALNVIEGKYSDHQKSPGTFCDNEQKLDVSWKVGVDKADASFDTNGAIHVDLTLAPSMVSVSGYRKGGILCSWMGGRGSLGLDRLYSHFKIYSLDDQGNPALDIIDIQLGKFALGRVSILLPGSIEVSGEAPDWLNSWLTTALQKTLSYIMTTELKKNIENLIGKRLKDIIEGGPFSDEPLVFVKSLTP